MILVEQKWAKEIFLLCYSQLLSSVYCEPCLLLVNRLYKHFNNAWFVKALNDWRDLSKKFKDHLIRNIHINSCTSYGIRKNSQYISGMFQEDALSFVQNPC